MKRFLSILLTVSIVLTSPSFVWAKKSSNCHPDGESLDSTSENQVDWRDKFHFTDSNYEYYVGLSTQNKKLEEGKHAATEGAKNAILDSIGELIQFKNQGVVTLDESQMHNAWGSLKAPTFLKHKEVTDWYYEKWASYSNCQQSFYYNVWVLMRVPKNELKTEKQKALAYLEEAQRKEMAKEAPELMPDSKLSVSDRIERVQKIETTSPTQINYLEEIQKAERKTKAKKPWYKSTAFWVITGLVVAGGATAGVMLGKGSSGSSATSGGDSGAGGGSGGGSGGSTPSINITAPVP
ncbi:MAG TPA: hypothetical protein PKU96_03780 [bacterium]|nr:hypothetical protein [bacterium]